MATVAELRAKIAAGEIKFGGEKSKGVGEGLFLCTIEKAELAKGEGGNIRGAISCKVLQGQTDKDVGGKFNIYVQTLKEDYLQESIAEWTTYAKKWGISEERLYEDADTLVDIIGNTLMMVNKLALKGVLRVLVKRTASGKTSAKNGKPMYWSDVQEVSRADESAPEAAPAPAPAAAAPVAAPVVTPAPAPAPAAAAPVAAPVAPAPVAEKPKKPWMK